MPQQIRNIFRREPRKYLKEFIWHNYEFTKLEHIWPGKVIFMSTPDLKLLLQWVQPLWMCQLFLHNIWLNCLLISDNIEMIMELVKYPCHKDGR